MGAGPGARSLRLPAPPGRGGGSEADPGLFDRRARAGLLDPGEPFHPPLEAAARLRRELPQGAEEHRLDGTGGTRALRASHASRSDQLVFRAITTKSTPASAFTVAWKFRRLRSSG